MLVITTTYKRKYNYPYFVASAKSKHVRFKNSPGIFVTQTSCFKIKANTVITSSSYSTLSSGNIVAIKIYSSDQKIQILKENKNKSGIYQLKNNINGKTYIGSSTNLGIRLRCYLQICFLTNAIKKNKSLIYRALLKYGYCNFSFEILEYCSAENCTKREQYYLDSLPRAYNILSNAASLLGFKHSKETRTKQARANMGEKKPMYGKKVTHSE